MADVVTLDNCEREPIHVPGAVQPHGVLFGCGHDEKLTISHVSENVAQLFGRPIEEVIGRPLFELFAGASAESLAEILTTKTLRELNPMRVNGADGAPLDLTVHRSGDTIVCEIERRTEDTTTFDVRLRQALVRLQVARDVTSLTQIAADEVRRLTGFDRVMVYRFDDDWNGEVVAEAKRGDLEPFFGLHYPASDIPAQARRLYTENWLRLIADVSYRPVRIVPDCDSNAAAPLDLSGAGLRSVSPIHIEYLKNMGVSASMSISLVYEGELKGLIACHHYSGPHLVGIGVRESSEYLGQALSWNIRVLEQAGDAERARSVQACETQLAQRLAVAEDLLDALAVPALMDLTGAAGAAIVLDEGVRTVGVTPDERRIGEIIGWLRTNRQDVFATDHLAAHYSPAEHWDGIAAGVVAVAVSHDVGEYLLWFRPSSERTVDWAGDPRKNTSLGDAETAPRLSPRGSFALWRETVRGRSLPWERWQLTAASNVRRLLLGGMRRRAASLRTLNRRLTEADRAKDVFIATISHELRTPLNAISGWSRLVTTGGLPADRWGDAMQIVSRNSDTLSRLVEDLLDVSRIVSGKLALEVESVDVASVLESCVDAISLSADAKNIRLKRIIESAGLSVLGDPTRLRQIFTNLLTNAVKFTPKGGSVTVVLRRHASDVEISVRDTGLGIDRDMLANVFVPFWQADGSSTRSAQGLGLGLAIAQKLVELHGGKLHAESDGSDQGSTFYVRLPVASARRDEEVVSTQGSRPPNDVLHGVHILVVEDEADSRTLLEHLLQTAGATVQAASNAHEALAIVEQQRFDALVSDVGLPEMDGLELVKRLRSRPETTSAKLPAVALTAYTRAYDRTSALRAGFQAHVPKPADQDELIAVLASLLGRL